MEKEFLEVNQILCYLDDRGDYAVMLSATGTINVFKTCKKRLRQRVRAADPLVLSSAICGAAPQTTSAC